MKSLPKWHETGARQSDLFLAHTSPLPLSGRNAYALNDGAVRTPIVAVHPRREHLIAYSMHGRIDVRGALAKQRLIDRSASERCETLFSQDPR